MSEQPEVPPVDADVIDEGGSTELEVREAPAVAVAPQHPSMSSDATIQRAYRKAAALAQSNIYKDVRSAEAVFAKLLVGQSLGLSEAQALSLYVVEGKIEIPYPMLAQFIRSREGYDYRLGWLKLEEGSDDVVAVWADEEEPADMREIIGAVVRFTVDGEQRGVYRWTKKDSEQANLIKDKSAHGKYPRAMYFARALSAGAKAHVPEVFTGMPTLYVEGELPRGEAIGAEIAAAGDGEPGWGELPIDWTHAVEQRIRRAQSYGHAGLSNRRAIQHQLRSASQTEVQQWLDMADRELRVFRDTVGAGEEPSPEPESADERTPVAPDAPDATDVDVQQLQSQLSLAEARFTAAQSESEAESARRDVERLRAAVDAALGE